MRESEEIGLFESAHTAFLAHCPDNHHATTAARPGAQCCASSTATTCDSCLQTKVGHGPYVKSPNKPPTVNYCTVRVAITKEFQTDLSDVPDQPNQSAFPVLRPRVSEGHGWPRPAARPSR